MDQKVICHGFICSRGLTIIEERTPDTTNKGTLEFYTEDVRDLDMAKHR